MPTYHGFYLDGRQLADDHWDPDDWDEQIGWIAKKVLSGQSLRTLVSDTEREAYKTRWDDWEDEARGEFLELHEDQLEKDGLEVGKAADEWIRGFHDRNQMLLEEAVIEEIEDIVDEEDGEEGGGEEDEGDEKEDEEAEADPPKKASVRGKK